MEIIQFFIDLLRDPRQFIADWIETLGAWAYAPLFAIIFVETGLVIMPFLPGDSLLFAAGVFAAPDQGGFNIVVLIGLLITAAVLGNTSNYWIGRKIGQTIIDSGRVKALTPERIAESQVYIDKYGPVAIVITRFAPFLRTFAPFLAGVGRMSFPRFTLFNVIGGTLWVTLFTLLGYFFGGMPFVVKYFEVVIFAIVFLSLMPMLIGAIRVRMRKRKGGGEGEAEGAAESAEESPADSADESPES